MSQVKPARSGTSVLSGVFEKVSTEGDALNFFGSNAGLRQILRATEDTTSSIAHDFGVLVDSLDPETGDQGSVLHTYDFTLDFNYLVGAKQLFVALKAYVGGTTTTHQPTYTYVILPSKELKDADPTFVTNEPWYEEVDLNTVRVHNLRSDRMLLFFVPHTAVPSVNKEKITVKNQGNNEAVEFEGPGDGWISRSPNGSRWLCRITDGGTLAIESR
jgi:hypothetical protein